MVAVACEIFAARWTPMIVRELLAGSHHFNEIHRGLPSMSRALLARRFPVPPDSPRDRERALGFLVRKGYEPELAYDALRRHAKAA